MTVQTMSGNVAPPFCYCWTHFWSTSWSSNYAYHISFQILGSQESSASNGMLFGGEMKKLWPFKDEHTKLSENFAAAPPFRSRPTPFRSCEMGCENGTRLRKSHLAAKWFRSPIATPCQILHLLQKWLFVAKWFSNFQMAMKWSPSFEMPVKWSPSFEMAAKWFSSFKMGCENVSIFSMGCENVFLFSLWLQNDLQATKWPSGYKNDLQNKERFAKTLCKAKGSWENAKRAMQPCI